MRIWRFLGSSKWFWLGFETRFWDRRFSFWYLGIRHLGKPGSEVTSHVPYCSLDWIGTPYSWVGYKCCVLRPDIFNLSIFNNLNFFDQSPVLVLKTDDWLTDSSLCAREKRSRSVCSFNATSLASRTLSLSCVIGEVVIGGRMRGWIIALDNFFRLTHGRNIADDSVLPMTSPSEIKRQF